MSDIFLSYASRDRSKAIEIARELEKIGWSVWWDRKIPPGKTFANVIKEAIDNSQCIVVLWSEASVTSEWVQNEASEGLRRGTLVPAMIDAPIEIPFEFRRIQAASLTGKKSVAAQKEWGLFRAAIAGMLSEPTAPSIPDAPPKKPWYRNPLALGGCTALMIALLGWAVYSRYDAQPTGESTPKEATSFSDNAPLAPWPPEGPALNSTRIAFHSGENGHWELFDIKPDSTDQRRITFESASSFSPSWSPDGERMTFFSDRDEGPSLYAMYADGTHPRRLHATAPRTVDAPWRPDGKQIAFGMQLEDNYDIYLINRDGTGLKRLTDHPAFDGDPSWSPDGSRIAFTSNRDGEHQIFVMDAEGKNFIQLTDVVGRNENPAWSPDGAFIAFESQRDGNSEIYRMASDGRHPVRLTRNPEGDHEPSWSPDGKYIAFSSWRNGSTGIYIMDADGKNVRPLIHSNRDEGGPAWSPVLDGR